MELEIRPEPDRDEREAIAAVLAEADDAPDVYRSEWRRDAADEAALVPFETYLSAFSGRLSEDHVHSV